MSSPFGKPTTKYVKSHGFEVKRGAFQSLVYPPKALGHTNYLAAKLMGVYEPEVIGFLKEKASSSEVFVDLGSGDGFFCVGVARLASLRIIGYETNRFERDLARTLASANGVRFEARGLADVDELNSLPEGKLLLLSDVEGLEEDLIDPALVPHLKEATMVVETHEQFRPNVIEVLTRRFEATHYVTRIFAAPSAPETHPEVAGWTEKEVEYTVYDGHSKGDSWMTFVPK
ncbi:MAG: hypothetical protein JJE13_04500 [Thermoleophilia bacterium]|nr:hypothetical protein [Thermoleophilia bacterium]